MNKAEYIQWLDDSSWQVQKEEAELYGVKKPSDKKWDEMVEAIADAKFASPDDPAIATEEVEIVPEKVELEAELTDSNSDEPLSFEYIRQGVTRNCPVCGYEIRVALDGKTKICPVSNPDCPRPSPSEVN